MSPTNVPIVANPTFGFNKIFLNNTLLACIAGFANRYVALNIPTSVPPSLGSNDEFLAARLF